MIVGNHFNWVGGQYLGRIFVAYCALSLFVFYSINASAGVVARDKVWPTGTQLRVHFMNGTERQQDFVRGQASMWTTFGNIRFTDANGLEDSDIRIWLHNDPSGPNNSAVGTDASLVLTSEPTMNLTIVESTLDTQMGFERARRTVLHEFGHAIGLLHEHQSPVANLCFDEEETIRILTTTEGRSIDDIFNFFLTPFSEAETTFTEFDPESIMLFPLPAAFFTCGISFEVNSEISAVDQSFISQVYPAQAVSPPAGTNPTSNNDEVLVMGSTSGGGCQYISDANHNLDPTLPISLFLSFLYLFRRKIRLLFI